MSSKTGLLNTHRKRRCSKMVRGIVPCIYKSDENDSQKNDLKSPYHYYGQKIEKLQNTEEDKHPRHDQTNAEMIITLE